MTREESILYDRGYIDAMELVASRTCESCKHSNDISDERYTCNIVKSEDVFHEDFGCNKWESKNAKN